MVFYNPGHHAVSAVGRSLTVESKVSQAGKTVDECSQQCKVAVDIDAYTSLGSCKADASNVLKLLTLFMGVCCVRKWATPVPFRRLVDNSDVHT